MIESHEAGYAGTFVESPSQIVLVCGPARSGTTWVARALAAAADAAYAHEPDNPDIHPAAVPFVLRNGLVPVIETAAPEPGYRALWFDGLRRAAESRGHDGAYTIVKSVFCGLSVDWVARELKARVVLVRRNPLSVLTSWQTLGWQVPADLYGIRQRILERVVLPRGLPRPPTASVTGRITWWIALHLHLQDEYLGRRGDWIRVSHDEACLDPERILGGAATELGFPAFPRLSSYLAKTEGVLVDGLGRADDTRASRLLPDSWRGRLDDAVLRRVLDVVDSFPAAPWKELMPDVANAG